MPSGVELKLDQRELTVKGPKGTLSRVLPSEVEFEVDGAEARINRNSDERRARAMHGLIRSLVANMVIGVSQGFTKELEIQGVGYRAVAQGPNKLELAMGFSHPVFVDAPEGISFEVPQPTRVIVTGIDKELVGQVAANIRKIRKPEPYKGKGIRYAGERVLRKAGKSSKK